MAEPHRRRCSQTTSTGRPCRNYAIEGSDRCASHLSLTGPKATLTVELIDRIASYVRAGNHVAVACAAVGVPKQTFAYWWKRGVEPGHRNLVYAMLRERVDTAAAEAEVRLAALVSGEARENAAWAAWLLERKWPERWARVNQREVTEDVDEDDPFREVDQLAEQRRKRIGHES